MVEPQQDTGYTACAARPILFSIYVYVTTQRLGHTILPSSPAAPPHRCAHSCGERAWVMGSPHGRPAYQRFRPSCRPAMISRAITPAYMGEALACQECLVWVHATDRVRDASRPVGLRVATHDCSWLRVVAADRRWAHQSGPRCCCIIYGMHQPDSHSAVTINGLRPTYAETRLALPRNGHTHSAPSHYAHNGERTSASPGMHREQPVVSQYRQPPHESIYQ